MRRAPKVSVIVPCYNSARYLPEAIESVLAQTYQDFEIILVDDGSSDGTSDIAPKFVTQVRYLHQVNQGPSSARNAGIEIASGEYLVFLDADDLLLPRKLELQSAFLDHNPEIDVVYSNGYCFSFNKDGVEELIPFSKKGYLQKSLGSSHISREILLIQNAFPINAAMIRRNVVVDLGGFDEDLIGLEDWDLWLRAAEKSNFAYIDRYLAKYRLVPGGVSTNIGLQKRALDKLGQKIELANWFPSLSSLLKSDFYFCWGIQCLEFGEADLAIDRFRKARALDSGNLMIWAAYLSTKLLGKGALIPYHLKRKMLGAGGNFRAVRI